MHLLIRKGSKTKLAVEWTAQRTISRLRVLGNGARLGEFPSAAEAKAHGETLLSHHRADTYLVLDGNGCIVHWVYDHDEQNRLERWRGRRNALITTCVLALITAATEMILGISLSSTLGEMLMAGSVVLHLIMRSSQNAIEALVAWSIMFVLIAISLCLSRVYGPGKGGRGTGHTPVDQKPAAADDAASWLPPRPTAP